MTPNNPTKVLHSYDAKNGKSSGPFSNRNPSNGGPGAGIEVDSTSGGVFTTFSQHYPNAVSTDRSENMKQRDESSHQRVKKSSLGFDAELEEQLASVVGSAGE